jgi:hypothetical protein
MGGSVNIGAITINQTGTGGVTIYMASGGLTMNSAANVNLTAPTSGQQAGMVIWQATGDTNAMILDSASNSNWNGAVYVPSAQLTLNGGSTATAYGMVVAQSVMLDSAISLGNCGSGGGNGSTTIALAE